MFESAKKKLTRVYNLAKTGTNLGIGLIMIVIFTVIAFGVFYGANTSSWGTNVTQIWQYIPLIVVAVIIASIAGYAMLSSRE
jgi:amino acid transporter